MHHEKIWLWWTYLCRGSILTVAFAENGFVALISSIFSHVAFAFPLLSVNWIHVALPIAKRRAVKWRQALLCKSLDSDTTNRGPFRALQSARGLITDNLLSAWNAWPHSSCCGGMHLLLLWGCTLRRERRVMNQFPILIRPAIFYSWKWYAFCRGIMHWNVLGKQWIYIRDWLFIVSGSILHSYNFLLLFS